MAYTFGARLDDDSYALTTIDEDQGTASTKGEINGVPFESGGGGGSSDFSTANVTLVISGGETGITLPAIRALDPPVEGLNEVLVSTYYVSDNSGTYEIALYNGATVLFQHNQYFADNVSVSGNAIYDPNYPDTPAIIISGDCTITLS